MSAAGIFAALKRIREADEKNGLVHKSNKKTPYINVENIVDRGRSETFSTYLRMHKLERPEPAHLNEWHNCHDCAWLRARGLLAMRGYGTLVTYIGITQFADYLDSIPKKDAAIDWRELTITEARIMFRKLCSDIGIRPRSFGPFVHSIVRATVGELADLRIFGGKKLSAPPPWCVRELAWKQVRSELKEKHYRAQAVRQGRREAQLDEDGELPPYGSRNPKARAPRKRKKNYKIVEEDDEEEESAEPEDSSEQPVLIDSPYFDIRTPNTPKVRRTYPDTPRSPSESPDNSSSESDRPVLIDSPFSLKTPKPAPASSRVQNLQILTDDENSE